MIPRRGKYYYKFYFLENSYQYKLQTGAWCVYAAFSRVLEKSLQTIYVGVKIARDGNLLQFSHRVRGSPKPFVVALRVGRPRKKSSTEH